MVFLGGGGGVGIQGVELAKVMGSCPIVVDTGEPKRTISMEMGAEAFVDFQESNAIEAVLKIADGVEHMACLLLLRLHIRACANYTGDGIGAVVICAPEYHQPIL